MADSEVKIQIKATADMAAAKTAEQQLESLSKAQKESTKATTEATPAVKENSNAVKEQGESGKKTGEQNKFFGMSLEKIKESMNQARQQVPGLNVAFLALRNPLLLASAAVGALIVKLNELNQQEYQSKLDQLKETTDALDNQRAALDELKIGANAYNTSLQQIRSTIVSATEALVAMNDEADRNKNLQDRLADKQKGVDLAKARAAIKDPIKLKEEEFAIESRYAEAKLKRDDETDRRKFANHKAAIEVAGKNESELDVRLKREQAEQAAAVVNLARLKDRPEKEKKALEESEKALIDAQQQYDVAFAGGGHGAVAAGLLKSKLDAAQAARDAQARLVDQTIQDEVNAKIRAESATAAVESTRALKAGEAKTRYELERNTPTLFRQMGNEASTRRQEYQLGQDAGAINLQRERDEAKAKQAEEDARKRQEEEERRRQEAGKMVSRIGEGAAGKVVQLNQEVNGQMLRIMELLVGNAEGMKPRLDRVESQLRNNRQ